VAFDVPPVSLPGLHQFVTNLVNVTSRDFGVKTLRAVLPGQRQQIRIQ
jgi:hypothetical protein